jgi:hypothetical protein
MKTKANFKRGETYYYAPKATLACAFLCGGAILGGKPIPLYLKSPEPRSGFHRVALTVIRTKAEAKALNRKYAKLRAKRRAEAKSEAA